MAMTIRNMRQSDLPSLQKLYLDGQIATFTWMSQDMFWLEDFEKSVEGDTVIVAENKGVVIGFCSIWEDDFIHNLFVDINLQRSDALSNLLKRPVRLKCTVQNTKACTFYEATGWKIEKTVVEPKMGDYHVYILD